MSVAIAVGPPRQGAGPVVVALGDSITAGVGDAGAPGAPAGPGWAGRLAQVVGASRFVNLARDGARARHVVDEQLPRALALLPDVATVVVGGDDVLRPDFCARDVARDVSTAVTALRDVGATVVLARLPAIALFELMPTVVRRVVRARVAEVNAVVDAVARASRPATVSELGALRASRAAPGTDRGPGIDDGRGRGAVVVVDLADAARLAGRAAWHADRVHPSAAGHRALAAVAAAALDRAGAIVLPEAGVGDVSAPARATACAGADTPRAAAPVSARARLAWQAVAGLPWWVRRGLVPGLVRAVVDDVRGRRPSASRPLEIRGGRPPGADARPLDGSATTPAA